MAQIATAVFTGPLRFLFPIFQLAVLSILTLCAETSYSAFPRLASLLASDRFLPSQFVFKGDRLAFSVGIIVLASWQARCLLASRAIPPGSLTCLQWDLRFLHAIESRHGSTLVAAAEREAGLAREFRLIYPDWKGTQFHTSRENLLGR